MFLIRSFLAVALVLGTIFWCCWQVLFASKAEEDRSSDLAGMAWRGSSAGASAIFWLWSWHACYTMRSELRMKNAIFAIFAMFAIFAIFVSKIMQILQRLQIFCVRGSECATVVIFWDCTSASDVVLPPARRRLPRVGDIQLLTQYPPPCLKDGRGKREESRVKREEGRGKREEGREKREERRGNREQGRGNR